MDEMTYSPGDQALQGSIAGDLLEAFRDARVMFLSRDVDEFAAAIGALADAPQVSGVC